MSAWYDVKTRAEVVNLKLFSKLQVMKFINESENKPIRKDFCFFANVFFFKLILLLLSLAFRRHLWNKWIRPFAGIHDRKGITKLCGIATTWNSQRSPVVTAFVGLCGYSASSFWKHW